MSRSSTTAIHEVEVAVQRKNKIKPWWLGAFLSRTFFGSCSTHLIRRNEMNRYCINCNLSACQYCMSSDNHRHHKILKIYRHVYKDVVSLCAMEKYIDCSQIQPFKCNKRLVLSLNPLPHCGPLSNDGVCEICKRRIAEPQLYTYCSISCKFGVEVKIGQIYCKTSTPNCMKQPDHCIQSATSLALCHRFFNTHDGVYGLYDSNNSNSPSSIQVPGLPPFVTKDIPSFLLPNNPHPSLVPAFQHHIHVLEQEPKSCVLINTFDSLEEEAITAVGNINPIPIGPLIPLALLDKNYQSDTSCGCDLFEKSTEYIKWLNLKPESSIVYVAFGSVVVLQRDQMEEILLGLISTRRPFLWIIQPSVNQDREFEEMIRKKVNEEVGFIVPWCSQIEVLTHESIGCFITHCGWNSTMESLVAGIPVVGLPQLADQTTNAKMVEEVWKNGVRARVKEGGVVEAKEIMRCVEMVMGSGEKGQEIRRNAKKWSGLALEAVKASHHNLKAFMKKVTK